MKEMHVFLADQKEGKSKRESVLLLEMYFSFFSFSCTGLLACLAGDVFVSSLDALLPRNGIIII